MKGLTILALAGAALASPMPQGSTPSGCQSSVSGTFQITVVNVTQTKRDLERRQLDGILTLTLQGGILKDQAQRIGYIASNRQFQFDNPVQAGAISQSGWSVCSNNSLALAGSAIFYQCLSGEFYNLYDQSQGGQCAAIYIETMSGSGMAAPSGGQSVSAIPDGQPQASTAAVSQISDGQIQASTAKPAVTQISDGQIQASTGKPAPVTQISDGQIQATRPAITQISDGQIQGPKATQPPKPAVSQISDGQIQATTGVPKPAAPVTQISDGQIQASTGRAPVTQISDGQIQASTAAKTAAPVTQISDGQIQATTARPAVSQISDGQIQATTARPAVSQISDGQIQATTAAAVATFTGAAAPQARGGAFALAAGIVGAVALL